MGISSDCCHAIPKHPLRKWYKNVLDAAVVKIYMVRHDLGERDGKCHDCCHMKITLQMCCVNQLYWEGHRPLRSHTAPPSSSSLETLLFCVLILFYMYQPEQNPAEKYRLRREEFKESRQKFVWGWLVYCSWCSSFVNALTMGVSSVLRSILLLLLMFLS